jgi:hypothetical protein
VITRDDECIILTAKMAARLALYDEFDTYWQNDGYKKISDIIFAEWHIFIVSNLWPGSSSVLIICDLFNSHALLYT